MANRAHWGLRSGGIVDVWNGAEKANNNSYFNFDLLLSNLFNSFTKHQSKKIPGLLIRPIKIRQEVHISWSRITTKNQWFNFKQSKMVFVRILHLHYCIWGNKKRKHAKFSEKRTFFTPWYATYVCSFLLIYDLEYTSEFFYQTLGSRRQILRLFHYSLLR